VRVGQAEAVAARDVITGRLGPAAHVVKMAAHVQRLQVQAGDPERIATDEPQRVIGDELKAQFKQKEGRLPEALVACVGGGSNAMGTFYPFEDDAAVKLYGVEAAGKGLESGMHAASLSAGEEGVFHGMLSFVLQDSEGQIQNTHSVSAGLDYPGVGPEHSFLKTLRRAEYVSATDNEAVNAFLKMSKLEGILPALESAHAVAFAMKLARKMKRTESIVVTLSGRGDKDVETIADYLKVKI